MTHLHDRETRRVEDMDSTFRFAKSFSGNVRNWDVSSVTDMSKMFLSCKFFPQRRERMGREPS